VKALVLAGGRGSRLNALTNEKNKCMCVFEGRVIIEYNLDNAVRAGVEEIVIVVGYKAETIINQFGNRYRGVPVRYVIQWERKGLVHAIECAEAQLAGHDFMLLLADEILVDPRHEAMVEEFRDPDVFALCGTVRVEDLSQIRKTYAVITDERTGRIHRLVEKPRTPLNDIQGTGNCVFRSDIFGYIAHTPINQQRQEKELPDLIQCAIDDGKIVRSFDIASWYTNVNTLAELNRRPEAAALAGLSSLAAPEMDGPIAV
jgi:UDP-N-acetylglucosamine diphosphorylase / glucose-1-phosphate thymidylyltransferase / UDP-N-acetylgalactosamine diphosphorylase / glucosamine-1-phosphate N-acetyltransferase / galactosamine-1-phosphate N-acetyltransferase